MDEILFTEYYGIEATGHRIGLMSCKTCGAVVLIGDADFNSPTAHREWHKLIAELMAK
jgi:hypothetical protein